MYRTPRRNRFTCTMSMSTAHRPRLHNQVPNFLINEDGVDDSGVCGPKFFEV